MIDNRKPAGRATSSHLSRRSFLDRALIGATSVAAVGLLAACGAPAPTPANPTSPPAGAPKPTVPAPAAPAATPAPAVAPTAPAKAAAPPKSGGTLTLAIGADFRTLDPPNYNGSIDTNALELLFDNLVGFDTDLKFKPALAESWEHPDPLTYRFNIRKGVKFTDGTPLNAQAVKASYDRASQAAPVAAQFQIIGSTNVQSDYVVEMKLKKPYADFLIVVSRPYLGITSPAAVEKFGKDFAVNPVGTGPYMLKERIPQQHTTLVRNPDYWGPQPLLDTIAWRPIPEEGARMLALQSGQVDAVKDPAPHRIPELQKSENLTVLRKPGALVVYVAFNHSDPLFEDVRVRQAIHMAIDRDALVKNVLEGQATLATGFFAPPITATIGGLSAPSLPPYDPARARQLLQEAGKSGMKIERFLTPQGRYLRDKELAEAVQQQLKAVGIDADLQVLELGAFFDAMYANKSQLAILGWGGTTPEPSNGADVALASNSNLNFTHYVNPKVDELLLAFQATEAPAARQKALQSIQDELASTVAFVPIDWQDSTWAINKRVQDMGVTAAGDPVLLTSTWVT